MTAILTIEQPKINGFTKLVKHSKFVKITKFTFGYFTGNKEVVSLGTACDDSYLESINSTASRGALFSSLHVMTSCVCY